MKKSTMLLALLAVFACKKAPEKSQNSNPEPVTEEKAEPNFPESLTKVLDAHGGFNHWKQQRTLSFVLPGNGTPETHTVDLWSRRDRIDTDAFSMGFDGNRAWLLDTEKAYKGNVMFYHNLMFYFYAMPFVLSDQGIVYSETEDLTYEGKAYPGLKIGFQSGVGASSNDEYFLHFDPETHQMAWLGYTVTFGSEATSDNVRWIRYHDWQKVNGILLPKSISWHKYEGKTIMEPRNTLTFEAAKLSGKPMPDNFYQKPENAEFVN
ncbi:MAG: DUF6503 family protein [Allomuricauda sp.]